MGLLTGADEQAWLREIQMSKWSLRGLFGRERSRKSTPQISQEDLCTTGVVDSGDFHINLAQRTATLCGKNLPLSSNEFDVLVYLSRHPRRLVTPHTMLATNWSGNGPHQTAFLRCLLSLRSKLDAVAGGKHYLRTEPWILYCFDPCSPPAEEGMPQSRQRASSSPIHESCTAAQTA